MMEGQNLSGLIKLIYQTHTPVPKIIKQFYLAQGHAHMNIFKESNYVNYKLRWCGIGT